MATTQLESTAKKANSFNKLNAATRRAIYSMGILIALFVLFSAISADKFLAAANLQNLLQQIVTYTIICLKAPQTYISDIQSRISKPFLCRNLSSC